MDDIAPGLSLNELLQFAGRLAWARPLALYPGWRFDIDYENPDFLFRMRRLIWEYARDNKLEESVLIPWHDGLKVHSYLGNDLSKQLYVGGCIDPNEFVFLEKILSPGMTFLDLGANEGLYSLFAARRVDPQGCVWSFEPSAREVARLNRNLAENQLPVRVFQAALADTNGEAELAIAVHEHGGQNTIGGFGNENIELIRKERVSVKRLDDLVAAEALARVDVIKMDIEGGEMLTLKGAAETLRRFKPVLMLEMNDKTLKQKGSSSAAMLDMLRSLRYTVYAFDPGTGLPVPLKDQESSPNIVAVHEESRLPQGGAGAASEPMLSGDAKPEPEPLVSFVATSRNDDHGGSLLRRMQIFVTGLIEQCKRHKLNAELILVEWNPPPDRPRFAQALKWPADTGPCRVRIIEVPTELHMRFQHAAALPLFQMIAKNAGIRRARGKFIVATNIDVLFNDELIRWVASGAMRKGRMYRIDRHDAMAEVPMDAGIDAQLEYCRTHLLRLNSLDGTFKVTASGSPDTSDMQAVEAEPPEKHAVSAPAGDIVSERSGVKIGGGWHPFESFHGECFRWAGNNAVLEIKTPSGPPGPLMLEIAPGPGMGGKPLQLQVLDEAGQVVSACAIARRQTVALSLPPPRQPGSVQLFMLRAEGGGHAIPGDSRILNFQVFHCGWTAAGASRRQLRRVARKLRVAYAKLLPERNQGARLTSAAEAIERLHTNGCGDFTLMAREHWFDLHGYAELHAFSFHIDSLLCHCAHHAGVKEELLKDPMRIYHIEHGSGSGWTPEGQAALFKRIEAKGIPCIQYDSFVFWAAKMRQMKGPLYFNEEPWGMPDAIMPETVIGA